MVSITNAADEYVMSSVGMETAFTVSTSMTMDAPTTKAADERGLLWVPYVVLTLILLSLLVASFVHFHVKYRDRYVKRSVLAKAVRIGPDCIAGEDDSPEKKTYSNLNINRDSTLHRVPSGAKTRRLKMFYGNKVDVGSIVIKSMFKEEFPQEGHFNEAMDLSQEDGEINHTEDDTYYHMDGTPRLTLQVPRRDSNMEMSSSSSSKSLTVAPKGERPRYGVSIWTTTAAAKKHNSKREKAQTGL